MTVFVFRNGVLVPKGADRAFDLNGARSDLPMPMLSRIEPFESPVTGKQISSWRERDRDMAAAGAVDPRDLKEVRHATRRNQPADSAAFEWGRLAEPGA